jgi:hypothetical protein
MAHHALQNSSEIIAEVNDERLRNASGAAYAYTEIVPTKENSGRACKPESSTALALSITYIESTKTPRQ